MRKLIIILIFPFVTFSQNELDKNFQKAETSFVKENYTRAFKFYKKSSDNGNTWAKLNLSYMYGEGIGIDKNEVKGSELYKQCYNDGYWGYTDEEYDEYLSGGFDNFNINKHYYWNTQLYIYDQEVAIKNLVSMYAFQLVKDKERLEYIYNLLINHSEINCLYQFCIGLMYKNGDYLIKDNQKAKDWFQMSIKNGCDFVSQYSLD